MKFVLIVAVFLAASAWGEVFPCVTNGPSHHIDTTWGYVGYQVINKPSAITLLTEIGVRKLTAKPSSVAALNFHQYVELDCTFEHPIVISAVHGVMSYIAWNKGIGLIAEVTGDDGDIAVIKLDQPATGSGSVPINGVFENGIHTSIIRVLLLDDLKPGLTQSWSLVLPLKRDAQAQKN